MSSNLEWPMGSHWLAGIVALAGFSALFSESVQAEDIPESAMNKFRESEAAKNDKLRQTEVGARNCKA